MSATLGSYLLHAKLLRPDQLDDLLQWQIINGGALDTQLLEGGIFNEAQVLKALGEAYQLPTVSREDVDKADSKLPEVFPRVFAETYRVIPYRLVKRELWVMVTDPPDAVAIAKLEGRLKIKIRIHVSSEARIYYAMQRLYNAEIPLRMQQLLAKLDDNWDKANQTPIVAFVEPAPVFQGVGLSSALADKEPPLDLETAQRRLHLGQDRDHIIDVVLNFAGQVFQFVGLFVIQGNSLVGYRGKGVALATMQLPRLSIPLLLPSMFKTVVDAKGHYLGQVPAASLNSTVLDDLGRRDPKTVFLAPFIMADRVRGIIYGDNGRRGVSSRRVADILLLMTQLGPNFERLIQRHKSEVSEALGTLQNRPPNPTAKPVAEPESVVHPPQPPADPARVEPAEVEPAWIEPDHDEESISIDEETTAPVSLFSLPKRVNVEPDAPVHPKDWNADPITEPVFNLVTSPLPSKPKISFADIDDEPEASAQQWEDVLVETIAAGKQGGTGEDVASGGIHVAEEVGWEDVIVEAAAAAQSEPVTAVLPPVDDMQVLLEALDSTDNEVAARAAESLWQRREEMIPLLGARFPGRLTIDPFASNQALPSLGDMSQVLRLLCALGDGATAIVLPHLDSQFPVYRLVATLFFGQVVSGAAFSKLLRRLFDEEPKIREAAADVLRRYRGLPGYDEGIEKIRERLAVPMAETQVRAAELLGRLRDGRAVPALITLTHNKRPEVVSSAAKALVRITTHDFASNARKWTEWWVKHSDTPREAWLVEALRQKDPLLVKLADEELRALTGLTFQFTTGDKKKQENAIRGWESWWESENRQRGRKGRSSR